MIKPDPDALARESLRNHRMFATGLLVFMAALTLYSYKLPQDWWSGLLQSAAKAGFVGGIADWFAITALFRHPLGIPIPHTAIIPNQRERLGRALGRFVANHVFTERRSVQRVGQTRPARHYPPLPGRSGVGPAGGGGSGRIAAEADDERRGRTSTAADDPHDAAHPGRRGRRASGGPRPAQHGRWRAPPGDVRLHPRPDEDHPGGAGKRPAPRDCRARARTGRQARGLGARRLGRPPGARRWSTPNWTK